MMRILRFSRDGTFAAAIVSLLFLFLMGMNSASAADTFADPAGSDVNDCLSAATPCETIQAAIDKAAANDTVTVAAGNYPESITIDKALTLNGAESGNPVSGRTFGAASESTIDASTDGPTAISVEAADVTIDGFSITNTRATGGVFGITVETAGDNAIIQNNIVDTIVSNDLGTNGSVSAQAIYLERGPDGVQILANRINNITSTPSTKGIFIGDTASTNPANNVLIEANIISNVTSNQRGSYGILVNGPASGGPHANLDILSNTIDGLTGSWAHGIGLEGPTSGAEVYYNILSNLTGNNFPPEGVFFEANPTFHTSLVNKNNLAIGEGNFGIALHSSLLATAGSDEVDGTCNWFGDENGPGDIVDTFVPTTTPRPGTGSAVTPNVDFDPWLGSDDLDGPCPFAILTLEKEVINDNGGTAVDTDWTLEANGPDSISGIEGNANVTNALVAPGNYTLSETGGPGGYTASDWVCNGGLSSVVNGNEIDIAAGEEVTCTITNDDKEKDTIKVIIKKYIDGALATEGGPFPMKSSWDAENIGAGSGNYLLSAGASYMAMTAPMTVGADYTTEETFAGDQVGEKCEDGKPYALVGYTTGSDEAEAAGKTPTTDVPDFEDLQEDRFVIVWNETCQTGLRIIKVVEQEGIGTAVAGDFTIEVLDSTPTVVKTDPGAEGPGGTLYTDLTAGDYTVNETNPGDYNVTYGGDCDSDGKVTITEGQTAECIVTNTYDTTDDPPLTTITNPTAGDTVSGIVDIRGTLEEDVAMGNWNLAICAASDDCSVPANRIEQNNVPNPAPQDNFTDQTIYTWDTTNGNFPDGAYVIRFAARDAAGNRDLSGDPFAGGDDSQHIIRVTVKNEFDGNKVTVLKYLDGKLATEGTFPMDDNNGFYDLDAGNNYMHMTSVAEGEGYWTSEVLGTNVGGDCHDGFPYGLVGYTKANTLEKAEKKHPTYRIPKYKRVTTDKYIIIWNETCPTDDCEERIRELTEQIRELTEIFRDDLHDIIREIRHADRKDRLPLIYELREIVHEFKETIHDLKQELKQAKKECKGGYGNGGKKHKYGYKNNRRW